MPSYKKHFNNKFVLNGVELENVSIGVSAIGKFEEPLDEAGLHLPFTIRDYEYPMRGLLQMYSEDYAGNTIENTYLILSDEVEEGSKYGEWKHNLRVMEYSGKYDSYLYHTFTYTKPLKNTNPAPFRFMNLLNITPSHTNTSYLVSRAYFLDPIGFISMYYTDETITLAKVDKGIQGTSIVADNLSRYAFVDVFVRVDNRPLEILSNGSYSFTLDEGDHEIDYGFISTSGSEIIDKTFYVKAISRSSLTLLDALNIVRDSKPFESKIYHEQTRLFNIDPEIEDYLATVEMPQMFLQKATMRQILNTMFSYVNAISRFYYETEGLDTLSMDEFNKITGDFDVQDVIAYASKQEAVGLFNQGITWAERALPSSFDEETVSTPAENMYKTVRSSQVQLTDTKFEIPLEVEMYRPIKLTTPIDEIKVRAFVSNDEQVETNVVLDLTPRFINREEWYLKLFTINFPEVDYETPFEDGVGLREKRVSNLYWQQGTKSINLSDVNGEVLQQNVVFSTIYEALNERITRYDFEPRFYNYGGETVLITGYQITYDLPSTTNFKDLKFQLKYISFESFPFQTHRENTTNSLYYTEGRLNQTDKALNIAFSSMRAYGDTQRSGVPSISFTKIYDDYSNILRWGMKDENDYIIVEEKFEYHNEFMKATYTATKDHNRLSLWTKVDQEYRWSEIPQTNQVFERQELFNENIIVYNPSVTVEEETTMIKDITLDLIFGTLMNDWQDTITDGKTKVTLSYVRTDGFATIYPDIIYFGSVNKKMILAPVRSFGGKHGFSFVFGFEGNQVAGNQLEMVNVSGSNTYWNKAVRYTDENGEFTNMWFALALNHSSTFNDGYTDEERLMNYPLTNTTLINNDEGPFELDNVTHASGSIHEYSSLHNPLMFGKKDKSQSVKVAIQTSVIPNNYKEYVLGLSFFTENFIVNNPTTEFDTVVGTPMYLYRYTNGTQYDKFSTYKIKTGYITPILLQSGVNANFDGEAFTFESVISLTGVTSWAIGDELGNLYLACNYGYNGFKVGRKHFYPNQIVLGSEKIGDDFVNTSLLGEIEIVDTILLEQFIFPIIDLTETITVLGQNTEYPSTDYVIPLEETITIGSTIGEVQSEDYVLGINDTIIISSALTSYKSTDFVEDLVDEIIVSGAIDVIPFVFPIVNFSDSISIVSTISEIKSTDYVLSGFADTITLNSTIAPIQFEFPILDFADTITVVSTFNPIQSTDYILSGFDDTITLLSDVEVVQFEFPIISLEDSIGVNSTIIITGPPTNWVYVGSTTMAYDNSVTFVGTGTDCGTSTSIDSWLTTNYPPANYTKNDIMRVKRESQEALCSPTYYYYRAD